MGFLLYLTPSQVIRITLYNRYKENKKYGENSEKIINNVVISYIRIFSKIKSG